MVDEGSFRPTRLNLHENVAVRVLIEVELAKKVTESVNDGWFLLLLVRE
jgi:hypothetical protein